MAAGPRCLALMQQTSAMPGVISYIAAISAGEKGKQWQQALGLLAVIQQSGVLPDVISYNPAISACAKGQQWHLLRWTMGSQSYTAAISACEQLARRASNGSRP